MRFPKLLVAVAVTTATISAQSAGPLQAAAYVTPASLDEWVFRFQTLAAALVALLGATVALATALLNNHLVRRNEARKELCRQVDVAMNLVSMIEAEKQFSKKTYLEGFMRTLYEVPNIHLDEIASWIEADVDTTAISISNLASFWQNARDECKGFPSKIRDLVSFAFWAAGRAALLVATAKQRGHTEENSSLLETATRTQHLLYATGIAAARVQVELVRFIADPSHYESRTFTERLKHRFLRQEPLGEWKFHIDFSNARRIYRFEVPHALSRSILDEASRIADQAAQNSASDLHKKDRSAKALYLPANAIDRFNSMLMSAKMAALDSGRQASCESLFLEMLDAYIAAATLPTQDHTSEDQANRSGVEQSS